MIPWTILGPLIVVGVIELALLIYAVMDWLKHEKMANRYLWLVVILLLNFVGPILYFMAAPRDNEEIVPDGDDIWK